MPEVIVRHAHIDDCPALARVLISATHGAFHGRVPEKCLTWITPEESAANWARNFTSPQSLEPGNFLFVAETDGEVIGLAMLGGITPDDGYEPPIAGRYAHELRVLQVAPAWQRQGVGRRLVARVAAQVDEANAARLLVRVLVDNPNLAFYERLGAVELGKRPYDWEGYQTEELLLGWEDVRDLLGRTARQRCNV
ncbi:MAG: GNAT family N-acetyltransferase [Caldilineales bacterium]